MEAFYVQKVLEKLKSVCVPGFFSLSMHKNLGVRLYNIKRRKMLKCHSLIGQTQCDYGI